MHFTVAGTYLGVYQGLFEPEVPTVLPADVRTAEQVDSDPVNVVALLKKRNHNVRMCLGMTSIILRPSVEYSRKDAGTNLICTAVFPLEQRNLTRPMHNMYLRLVSDNPV